MKYLVIGDIMIDRYVMGEATKISPEAPVPIIKHKVQYDILGGAANAARNIVSLENDPGCVDIVGYLGDDLDGELAQKHFNTEGINFIGWTTATKPTIVKERIFAGNQQMIRVDIEDNSEMPFDRALWGSIAYDYYDYIIVSDYAKGVINRHVMNQISPYGSKILIDPKPVNWKAYPFSNILLFTPNEKEYGEMRFDHIHMDFANTQSEQFVLVTKGKNGMTLYSNRQGHINIKSEDVENCEVIGAGDTVISAIAVTLANFGWSMNICCQVANECARYAVSQPGTASVPVEVFDNIIDRFQNSTFDEDE